MLLAHFVHNGFYKEKIGNHYMGNSLDEPKLHPSLQHLLGTQPTKVIAVSSGKGGVGKSQVALNLAVALAQKGKKILLLDGDLGLPSLDMMLGLSSNFNLYHVLQGRCSLQDILLSGPEGVFIIPGAFCKEEMRHLTSAQQAGIIDSFNDLTGDWDYLIIDTASGLSEHVLSFSRAAQEIILVVCDEPGSISATYAFIKLMNQRYKWMQFHILANMTTDIHEGREIVSKLSAVADQFLDVNFNLLGSIPFDLNLRKSIKKQQSIVAAIPDSLVARKFRRLAVIVDEWPLKFTMNANTSFFLERLLSG
jgi:flagellar biosynthesis protein FlhG